jgi:hypothetical protein
LGSGENDINENKTGVWNSFRKVASTAWALKKEHSSCHWHSHCVSWFDNTLLIV